MPANLPTPYPDLNAVLQELVESIQAILGRDFLAACLQGSFAVGDFDRHSDCDFVVAVERELSYCRMLRDLRAGTVGSKRTGAEWAKANLDPSWADLIDRAWAGRPKPEVSVRQPADPHDFDRTLEFVKYVMGRGAIIYGRLVA